MTYKLFEGKDIVCIGPVDWEPIWNRSQQLMSRMPQTNRVLYIEPPATLLSVFKDRSLWYKWCRWIKGARAVAENIYLYSPPIVLPFGNMFPWVNRLNQWLVSLFIKRIKRRLKFEKPVVWTYLPGSLELAKRLEPSLLVYDCVDEHSEFTGLINKEAVLKMEKELLENSDVVFTSALGLYQSKKEFARNIHLIPNAADTGLFGRAGLEETIVPDDVSGLPHPLLGFVGVIHHWIDLDLIAYLASQRPEWTVVLIGPVGAGVNIEPYKKIPNVLFLGHRDKEELPGYLKAFDVCLNTFKINQLTQSVNPLKIYEYLAAGRPVVSVDMPGVAEFAGIIEIAGDYDSFLKAVERVLELESPEKKQQRFKIAQEHSWENRLKKMIQLINIALGQEGGEEVSSQ